MSNLDVLLCSRFQTEINPLEKQYRRAHIAENALKHICATMSREELSAMQPQGLGDAVVTHILSEGHPEPNRAEAIWALDQANKRSEEWIRER
jgi:hypothetical protein